MTGIDLVVALIVLGTAGLFALSAGSRGRAGAHSRIELVGSLVDAGVALALGRLLLPWPVLTGSAWLVPVAIVAAGVVLGLLRWESLPWRREGRALWIDVVALAIRGILVVAVALLAAS